MENPRINWMMTRGTSFSGHLHVNIDDVPPGQSMNFASWKDLFPSYCWDYDESTLYPHVWLFHSYTVTQIQNLQ